MNSVYLVSKLKALGVVPNKSAIIQLPNIEYSLYKHFIRGYFDGDGYLNGVKRKRNKQTYREWTLNLVSASKCFLVSVQKIIKSETGCNGSISCKLNKKKKKCWCLSWCGNKSVPKIADFLYNDHNPSMDRRLKRYKELVSYYKGKEHEQFA